MKFGINQEGICCKWCICTRVHENHTVPEFFLQKMWTQNWVLAFTGKKNDSTVQFFCIRIYNRKDHTTYNLFLMCLLHQQMTHVFKIFVLVFTANKITRFTIFFVVAFIAMKKLHSIQFFGTCVCCPKNHLY